MYVFQFLPRDATQSALLPWYVVYPSVCQSVTLLDCDHTVTLVEILRKYFTMR